MTDNFSLLRQIKQTLNQKFLFIPKNKNFFTVYLDICLEFFLQRKISPVAVKVINELIEQKVLSPQTEMKFRYDFTEFSFYDFYLKNYDGRIYSRGSSVDLNEAIAKSLGEVFERQFTEYPEKNISVTEATVRHLKEKGVSFVDPKLYPQPTKSQKIAFPETFEYDDMTPLSWVKAKRLSVDAEVYILAQDAYWGFSYIKKEPKLVNQGTNGCGGGYTYQQALNSALFELVQRDTFFRFWYQKKSPQKINLTTIPGETKLSRLIDNLRKDSFEVSLLDMTEEAGVPTVTAVIKRPGTGWFLGASSSFSKHDSSYRALEEAFSIYMWTFQQAKNGTYDVHDFITEKVKDGFLDGRVTSRERCLLWGSKFYMEFQDKFLVEGENVNFKEVQPSKNFNLQEFAIKKFGEGYVVRSESRLLQEYGYFSLKVIFPAMYTLVLTEKLARPVLLDVYPQQLSPHPFP